MIRIALAAVALASVGVFMLANGSLRADSHTLTDESFASWRDFIRPKPEERRWEAIPWRPTLWDAAAAANKEDKPVLLWAMNGHPLACT